jgi:hypothetical protein
MEEFVDCAILGEFFKINKKGDVFSKRTNKVLKPTISRAGYRTICTKVGGKGGYNKTFRIARAVMLTFVGEVDDKPIVNHKDGVKTNDNFENLEWCTHSENTRHALDTGLTVRKTKYSKEEVDRLMLMMEKHSLREVSRLTGVCRKRLSIMKKGVYKPC